MSRKHVKQYLMLLLAVGVIAVSLSGGGTFATFNAQVANRSNTFVTGTLYLHETKTGTCTSESASSNSNLNTSGVHLGDACDVLFSGVNSSGYGLVKLTMKNAGTLDGDGLHLAFGDGATDGFTYNGCVSSTDWEQVGSVAATNGFTTSGGTDGAGTFTDASAGDTITSIHLTAALGIALYSGATFQITDSGNTETFTTTGIVSPTATTIPVVSHTTTNALSHSDPVKYSPQFNGGAGNLCSDLKLEIVEVPTAPDLNSVTVDPTTGNSSAPAGSTCALGGATNGTNGCDFTSASTLTSLAGSATYPTFTDLSLLSNPGGNHPNTLTGMDAGASRYIAVIVAVDPTASNSVQGLQAAFDLVWNMNQSTS